MTLEVTPKIIYNECGVLRLWALNSDVASSRRNRKRACISTPIYCRRKRSRYHVLENVRANAPGFREQRYILPCARRRERVFRTRSWHNPLACRLDSIGGRTQSRNRVGVFSKSCIRRSIVHTRRRPVSKSQRDGTARHAKHGSESQVALRDSFEIDEARERAQFTGESCSFETSHLRGRDSIRQKVLSERIHRRFVSWKHHGIYGDEAWRQFETITRQCRRHYRGRV